MLQDKLQKGSKQKIQTTVQKTVVGNSFEALTKVTEKGDKKGEGGAPLLNNG